MTSCILVTRSARIFFTSFSSEASDGCKHLCFRCLECCFLLPIEFTFPLVTLFMYVMATSACSPFASFTCTPNSKEILGIIGIGLTLRAPTSCIESICASSSCFLSLIMALSAFLFRQSRAQCGPSHRKHLILGGNSFISALLFPF